MAIWRTEIPPTPFRESIWVLPQPAFPVPFCLDSTGITHTDSKYYFNCDKGRNYYVLEYIIAGAGHLLIEDHHYRLEAGGVYILPPLIPHKYYSDPKDPWQKIWFNISGELIDHLAADYHLAGAIYLPHCPLEADFRHGIELVRSCGANVYTDLAVLVHKIIATIAHYRSLDPYNQLSPESLQLKHYLDSHWNDTITSTALARLIGKSVPQMLRIFRRAWHCTPGQYLQQRKMEIAVQYLENTAYMIREIAEMIGFANEFHFSNWFKRKKGISPRCFRQNKEDALLAECNTEIE